MWTTNDLFSVDIRRFPTFFITINATMKLIENKELFQAILNSSPNGITILQSVYNEKDKTVNFLVMLLKSAFDIFTK